MDYSLRARNFAFKHPLLSIIGIHVNFWIVAFLLLSIILHFDSVAVSIANSIELESVLIPRLIISLLIAVLYGITLGLFDYYFFKKWIRGKSLGLLTLLKGIFYFVIMLLIFGFIKEIFWEYVIVPYYFKNISPISNEKAWIYLFYIISIYTLSMSFVISFIIQISKKFGPGMLVPLLLGKYLNPKIEERIFIFLDLKSSTTHAENLGHIKYSRLIKDCFLDINKVSVNYQAEIYQYVGDEIVLCWVINQKLNPIIPLDFYFACQSIFNDRQDYYLAKYGILPEFKAGIHQGSVTAVEVGDIKREVAYHGDTLNVAARIQGMCNEYESNILISDVLKDKLSQDDKYLFKSVGLVSLRGRTEPISIFKVNQK